MMAVFPFSIRANNALVAGNYTYKIINFDEFTDLVFNVLLNHRLKQWKKLLH